jgi:hypothetical protein
MAGRGVIVRVRPIMRAIVRNHYRGRDVYGPRDGVIRDVIGGHIITGSIIIRRTVCPVPTSHGNSRHAQKCQYQQCQYDFFHPKQPPRLFGEDSPGKGHSSLLPGKQPLSLKSTALYYTFSAFPPFTFVMANAMLNVRYIS